MRSTRAIGVALVLSLGACRQGPEPIRAKVGELVEVARSDGYLWTGVAVSKKGRKFACYPRWFGEHKNSVVELLPSGKTRPFPSIEGNSWRPGVMVPLASEAWVCVQSVRCDGDSLF